MKDCPLCGERMRLSERDVPNRIPGGTQLTVRRVREWICPDCDYFEEADAEG